MTMRDNGVGVDPEQASRIFGMFSRANQRGRRRGDRAGGVPAGRRGPRRAHLGRAGRGRRQRLPLHRFRADRARRSPPRWPGRGGGAPGHRGGTAGRPCRRGLGRAPRLRDHGLHGLESESRIHARHSSRARRLGQWGTPANAGTDSRTGRFGTSRRTVGHSDADEAGRDGHVADAEVVLRRPDDPSRRGAHVLLADVAVPGGAAGAVAARARGPVPEHLQRDHRVPARRGAGVGGRAAQQLATRGVSRPRGPRRPPS